MGQLVVKAVVIVLKVKIDALKLQHPTTMTSVETRQAAAEEQISLGLIPLF